MTAAPRSTAFQRNTHAMRIRTALALTVLVMALVPLSPASAQALPGTIVYLQDGNVIASTPDGSASHVVAGGGVWEAPSMADDGTVVAVRDGETIVRMTQSGEVLSSFVPDDVFAGGIYDMEVSADGSLVAYASIMLCNRPNGDLDSCRNTELIPSDGRQTASLGGVVQSHGLTFVPGTSTVVVNGLETFGPGSTETTPWFDRGLVDVADIDISPDGSLLAVAGCDHGATEHPGLGCAPVIEMHRMNGAPPAAPTALPCFIVNDEEVVSFDDVSIAPNNGGVVFTERLADEDLDEAEVKVLTGFTADPCGATGELVLAEGATDPFWGAAAYDPDGGPVDPGPVDPGPVDPGEVVRIDGGGAADPIGQAVATSRSLFEDGAADRVVLATADRFPDALAGAALAGTRGPILLTPSGADLDPRVEAEIARVTGGDGTVLTLGGDAAVSELAATTARAAAGGRSCDAPLPSTCRFAGSGREDTAARIAEVVLAEQPGSRVLLARGDAFADAITGGAYAAAAGVPILLTPSTQLNQTTAAFLGAHTAVTEVVVLGGEAAVADTVVDQLSVPQVRRVSGADRTATSAAIATELWHAEGLDGGGVVVVNVRHDEGWQTALTAAVVSAAAGAPQLGVETPPAEASPAVIAAARTVGTSQVLTFGGADLVTDGQLAAIAG